MEKGFWIAGILQDRPIELFGCNLHYSSRKGRNNPEDDLEVTRVATATTGAQGTGLRGEAVSFFISENGGISSV